MNEQKLSNYRNMSPLERLKLWVDMPLSDVKEYYEMEHVGKYPDNFISQEEQVTQGI